MRDNSILLENNNYLTTDRLKTIAKWIALWESTKEKGVNTTWKYSHLDIKKP